MVPSNKAPTKVYMLKIVILSLEIGDLADIIAAVFNMNVLVGL